MYLRHAFNLWQKENKKGSFFKEDQHFSFVEFGGSNLSHWDFVEEDDPQISLESIVSKIFLIVDNDTDNFGKPKKGKKEDRLQAIEERFGDNFYRLECREIENLISCDVVKRVAQKLGAKDVESIALKEEDYKYELIGKFIENKFKTTKKITNQDDRISNKKTFAENAIESTHSIEDLSEEMINICEKINNFIEEANR